MSGLAIIICHIRLTNIHRLFYVLKVGTVQYSPTSKYSPNSPLLIVPSNHCCSTREIHT